MKNRKLTVMMVGAAMLALGLIGTARADVIPSPANDLLSQANGGVAAQTSTSFGAPASRANDGNRDGTFFGATTDNSVSHTSGGVNDALWVTIPTAAVFTQVDVWNRTDCCSDRLTPFQVDILRGGNGGVLQYSTGSMAFVQSQFIPSGDGGSGASGMFIPIPNVLGDTVRVMEDGGSPQFLHLAEVEGFGTVIPEPASCALLMIGGLGAGVYAWRRKRRTA